jgi:hypothetical protein
LYALNYPLPPGGNPIADNNNNNNNYYYMLIHGYLDAFVGLCEFTLGSFDQ